METTFVTATSQTLNMNNLFFSVDSFQNIFLQLYSPD